MRKYIKNAGLLSNLEFYIGNQPNSFRLTNYAQHFGSLHKINHSYKCIL